MKHTYHSINIGRHSCPWELIAGKKTSRLVCRDAAIDQIFANEDVAGLLDTLPKMVTAERKRRKDGIKALRKKITDLEKRLKARNNPRCPHNNVCCTGDPKTGMCSECFYEFYGGMFASPGGKRRKRK